MKIREIFSLAIAQLGFKQTIYLVLILVLIAAGCIGIGLLRSHLVIRSYEREIQAAKQQAADKEQLANAKEKEAENYKLHAERLEWEIGEIGKLARKQDEELQKISTTTNTARADADRARGVRALDSTSAELCQRLEELGHGC